MTSDVGLRSERGPILLAVMVATGLVAIDSTILATAVPSIVRRPRRLLAVPVAVLDLPARPGGDGAGLREARRHLRAQADHPVRHRAVPARLDPLRLRLEHAGADRVPRGAGPRRRRRSCRSRSRSSATSTRSRSAPRRRATSPACGRSSSVVGPTLGGVFAQFARWRVDLLRQHPAVPGRGLAAGPQLPREGRAQTHRIDYAGAILLTVGLTLLILGVLEGGQAWAWNSAASIGVFGARRACCWSRSCSSSAARPSRCCRSGSSRRRLLLTTDLIGVRRRRRADRPHLLRADLPRGGARHRSAGRRPRARRADDRLADRGVARRPVLPAHRLPLDGADRHRRSWSLATVPLALLAPHAVGRRRSRSSASSSASAWGFADGRRRLIAAQSSVRGTSAASSPAPTCSRARSAAPSASRSSARSRTASSVAGGERMRAPSPRPPGGLRRGPDRRGAGRGGGARPFRRRRSRSCPGRAPARSTRSTE